FKQDCELLVMSKKDKDKTFRLGLEAQRKAKALRFQPGAMPPSVFFALDAGRCRHRRDDHLFYWIRLISFPLFKSAPPTATDELFR
ncbi:MAG: hypothetical protein ACXVJ0_03155, partial [Candidatus Angelobacter sp.]